MGIILGNLQDQLKQEGYIFDGLRMDANDNITVVSSGDTTTVDARISEILSQLPLKEAKATKTQLLNLWYYQQTKSGITVSSYTFDASIESQNRIDALVTMIMAAILVGAADATVPFSAYDINGAAVTLPAGQLIGLMLQYGTAVATLSGTYAACQVAISTASTLEAVEAVVIPS